MFKALAAHARTLKLLALGLIVGSTGGHVAATVDDQKTPAIPAQTDAASCTTPAEEEDSVYFVSCGGFF